MSILADKNTKVIVQGITGTQASFHTKKSIEYGTKIVAGTSPHYQEGEYLGVPVFKSISEAQKHTEIDASLMFVPARALKNAVREAVEAEIKLIVSVADGVPVHDMLEIKAMLNGSETMMIGPNTPGIITPNEARLGIFPENLHKKGSVGIISRSSTLTYEAVVETNLAGLGQSSVIGLGDDMVIGTDYVEILKRFMADDETKAMVMLGKIDSLYEQKAAEYYDTLTAKKPLIALIVGESMPYNHMMGYAGDIITHGRITVADKKAILQKSGIIVVDSINQIHDELIKLNLK